MRANGDIGRRQSFGYKSCMRLDLSIFACAAALLSGCSSPEPSISLEQLAGAYRASSCPVIHIAGKQFSYDGKQSPVELIRIKDHDIIAAATTPRFASGNGCKLIVDGEPSYIQVDVVDGRFGFDIMSIDRTTAIRFVRDE
jgi:hypothetical protein